jgi:hypothetical protein
MTIASAIFAGRAVHQIGYATSDCKEAMRRYGERYGVRNFMYLDANRTEVAPGQVATIHVAMAFVGDTMIELIEPAGGADTIYREVLPASGFAVRQHHLGYAMFSEAEWEAAQVEARRLGVRVALQGEAPGVMRYQYLDTRADIGHYIEYLYYLGEGGKQLFGAVPRND